MTILPALIRTARLLQEPLLPSVALVAAYYALADELAVVSELELEAVGRAQRMGTTRRESRGERQ